jgi:hypothetical protein
LPNVGLLVHIGSDACVRLDQRSAASGAISAPLWPPWLTRPLPHHAHEDDLRFAHL